MANNNPVAYDPIKFLGTINGSPILDPADTDDAFTAKYTAPSVTPKAGMYGSGNHEIGTNRNGEFMVTLKPESPTNRTLSLLNEARARFTISYVNRNTNVEAAFSRKARVEEAPGVSGGVKAASKTWKISGLEATILEDGYREETLTV